MEKYEGNSNKSKIAQQEKEEIKPIGVNGSVKKKGVLEKTLSGFLAEDASKVKDYIVKDIIEPNSKDLIYKIFTGALSMFLFGKADTSKKTGSSWYSYGSVYSGKKKETYETESRNPNPYEHERIGFTTKGDAETILITMGDILERYGVVSIGDFKDICKRNGIGGITITPQDWDYGWDSLVGSETIRSIDGEYVIKFPKAKPIK